MSVSFLLPVVSMAGCIHASSRSSTLASAFTRGVLPEDGSWLRNRKLAALCSSQRCHWLVEMLVQAVTCTAFIVGGSAGSTWPLIGNIFMAHDDACSALPPASVAPQARPGSAAIPTSAWHGWCLSQAMQGHGQVLT